MAKDFTNSLNNIQSYVLQELLRSGIKDNEITNDNDYLVQQQEENVLYRDNSVHAVFNELYSPMRELGGSKPLGINVRQEDVYVNNKFTTVHIVTLGNGFLKLAEGREDVMNRLNNKLNRLRVDESVKNLVKKSYTEARVSYKADENKTLKILKDYHWIPWSFMSDIRRSRRDELTS